MKYILILPIFLLGFLLFGIAQQQQYVKDSYGNMIGDTLAPKDTIIDNTKYSIKNRWNLKASLSYNRSNEHADPIFDFEWDTNPISLKHNLRAECNYGILNWLEVGGYIGYMRYRNTYNDRKYYEKHKNDNNNIRRSFAPTFGVNVNVHLLPFWVKNKKCRWELYLTAKYGGAYLINHYEFTCISTTVVSSGKGNQSTRIYCAPERYRQIFGAGVGGGVYFKNLFGLYAEVLGGQCAYFPEISKSYYSVRVGFEFKFTPKSKKHKEEKRPL